MNEKAKFRSYMTTLRKALSSNEREYANDRIFKSLSNRPEMKYARRICIYVSLPEEVDTHVIIATLFKEKRAVIVPSITADSASTTLHRVRFFDDLIEGSYGVEEPKETCELVNKKTVDLFIVPGLSFDSKGYRLGWGKGYYDRLLANSRAPKIGIAYSCQILSRLPHSSYDIPMDVVITEKEIIDFRL